MLEILEGQKLLNLLRTVPGSYGKGVPLFLWFGLGKVDKLWVQSHTARRISESHLYFFLHHFLNGLKIRIDFFLEPLAYET